MQLVLDQGPKGPTSLRLEPGTVRVLGSHADCDLQVPAPSIAPLHLRLELTHGGALYAEDLSDGRTKVNSEPLRGRVLLTAGDELLVGDVSMRVESAVERATPARSDTAISKPGVESSSAIPMLPPGAVIGDRYRIIEKLAAGGMGEVYRAEHVELGRPFALKVMRAELKGQPDFADRFRREAVACSRIGHPNIIDITDFGSTDGHFYFAMELLTGQTLAAMIAAEGALPLRRVRHLVAQVCAGLSAAHALGIVHRDLKPENVMVLQRPGSPDHVKILDFGIAKVTSGISQGGQTGLGVIVGTPQYMSPEQAAGLSVDARTDIYSLGLIIYELLCGRPAFTGATPSLLIAKQVAEPPPPLMSTREPVPHALRSGVMRMLAKKPEERPQTMEDVLKIIGQEPALAHAAPTERGLTPPPQPPASGTLVAPVKPFTQLPTADLRAAPQRPMPPPRSRGPLALVAGAVVLVGGGAFALWSARKEPAPPPPQVETAAPQALAPPPPAKAPVVAAPAAVVPAKAAPVVKKKTPAPAKQHAATGEAKSDLKDVYGDETQLKEIP